MKAADDATSLVAPNPSITSAEAQNFCKALAYADGDTGWIRNL
jgi:hypothetical protein